MADKVQLVVARRLFYGDSALATASAQAHQQDDAEQHEVEGPAQGWTPQQFAERRTLRHVRIGHVGLSTDDGQRLQVVQQAVDLDGVVEDAVVGQHQRRSDKDEFAFANRVAESNDFVCLGQGDGR